MNVFIPSLYWCRVYVLLFFPRWASDFISSSIFVKVGELLCSNYLLPSIMPIFWKKMILVNWAQQLPKCTFCASCLSCMFFCIPLSLLQSSTSHFVTLELKLVFRELSLENVFKFSIRPNSECMRWTIQDARNWDSILMSGFLYRTAHALN